MGCRLPQLFEDMIPADVVTRVAIGDDGVIRNETGFSELHERSHVLHEWHRGAAVGEFKIMGVSLTAVEARLTRNRRRHEGPRIAELLGDRFARLHLEIAAAAIGETANIGVAKVTGSACDQS